MEFAGRYVIPASPEIVWAALNDPFVLQACIPGCESLTRVEGHRFDAVAALRIGPVKATFKAAIAQTELDPPRRCVLEGEGRGGVAGFARGKAEVTLAPDAQQTVLSYVAKGTIGGKLAQVGQRLIDGAAKQIADDFFARFAAHLTIPPVVPEEIIPPVLPPPADEQVAAPEPLRREGLAPEIWVIGLIAVIAILLVLFGVAI
jgi:carbon monoxide dehydrogenase subunit G